MSSKLLVYSTGKIVEAYTWRHGTLGDKQVFDAEHNGFAEFGQYLAARSKLPVHFLVDCIEEDFRLDTIPHLFGRSRNALIKRKLGQAFRTEIYRHTALQGRLPEGRRDDRLLLSALTNSETIKPWIDVVTASRMALAGIYSVPLLAQAIIAKLGLGKIPHLLLISRQDLTGLRQSYFQEGYLKLSRLVFASGDNARALAETIGSESNKIQSYLNNQRLLPRDQPLQIRLLFGTEECRDLAGGCVSTSVHRFSTHQLPDAAAALKLPPAAGRDMIALYLHFLARYPIPNHYANPGETRFWRLDRTALAMKATGIVLLTSGALSAGFDISQGRSLAAATDRTHAQARLLEAETSAMRNSFPLLPVDPDILKETAELATALAVNPDTPEALMTAIGHALELSPGVRLQRFKWMVSDSPSRDIAAPTSVQPAAAGVAATGGSYQIALLEGEIAPFTSYREALASVEHLIERLKGVPGLQITPLTLPIETGSQAQLKGSLSETSRPAAAKFSLKLVSGAARP